MDVHPSALKHGVLPKDVVRAAGGYVAEIELGDDPRRMLRLGFDTAGRLLETVVLHASTGRLLVIHAMGVRQQYIDEML